MDRSRFTSTSQALGIGTAFFMSGIYFGSSYIAIDPLLPLPINHSTRAFSDIYHSGVGLIIPLSLGSTILNAIAAYLTPERRLEFAIASAASVAPLAYTVTFMLGGINRLLQIMSMDGSQIQGVRKEEVIHLLLTWKGQNYVRAGLALVAGTIGLYAIFSRKSLGVKVQ